MYLRRVENSDTKTVSLGTPGILLFPVVGCRRNRLGQFLCCGRGRKPQICRRNFTDVCHIVGDISTSGLNGHIAISGYPSMSHLFVDTLLEFGVVVDNFVYRARITVILTSDSFGCIVIESVNVF